MNKDRMIDQCGNCKNYTAGECCQYITYAESWFPENQFLRWPVPKEPTDFCKRYKSKEQQKRERTE